MIEEACEGGVNRREGEGGMVILDGVGAPAVADMFLRNLDDSDAAVVNPRGAGGVAVDMGEGFGGHQVRKIKAAGRCAISLHLFPRGPFGFGGLHAADGGGVRHVLDVFPEGFILTGEDGKQANMIFPRLRAWESL